MVDCSGWVIIFMPFALLEVGAIAIGQPSLALLSPGLLYLVYYKVVAALVEFEEMM